MRLKYENTAVVYPFSPFEQSATVRDRMLAFTKDYICRFALFVEPLRYAQVVTHFAGLCTPSTLTDSALESACRYLTLILFVGDEGMGSTLDDRDMCFERYMRMLRGELPVQPRASDRALQELLDEVRRAAFKKDFAIFCEQLEHTFAAKRWERARLEKESKILSWAELRQRRPHGIANRGYVTMLRSMAGVSQEGIGPLNRARLLLLEELATRLIYLSNDICSYARERDEDYALSTVRLYVSCEDFSPETAVAAAVSDHNCGLEEYVSLKRTIEADCDAEQLRRWFEVLDVDIAGNLEAMRRMPERYDVSALMPPKQERL